MISGDTAQTPELILIVMIYVGKAIAVGLVEGGVNIYDYRDGSLISCIQPANSGSVHCLKWTDIYLGRPNHSSIFGTNVRTNRQNKHDQATYILGMDRICP